MRQHNSMMCYKLDCYLCNRVLIIHTYMHSVVSILAERCYMCSLFIFGDILYLYLQAGLKHCENSNCMHTQSLELRHSVPLLSNSSHKWSFPENLSWDNVNDFKSNCNVIISNYWGKSTCTGMVRAKNQLYWHKSLTLICFPPVIYLLSLA